MRWSVFYIVPLVIYLVSNLNGQTWPLNLKDIKSSICLVEYYQPQFEKSEIRDESRIKRKITGILVNDEGLVITSDIIFPANLDIISGNNAYAMVQSPPEDITVSFKREQKLKATFIGKDEELRLAFLKISDTSNLPSPVKFNSESNFSIGDRLYVIEHLDARFDYEVIYTTNNINAIVERPFQKLLLSAKVKTLSSGGLVLNDMGNPIGIVYRESSYFSNLDFDLEDSNYGLDLKVVLPANQFSNLLLDPPKLTLLKQGGGKSWLGIQMQVMTTDMANYWDLGNTRGIIVNSIVPNSPAQLAGLMPGDIITSIGKLQIKDENKQNLNIFRNYVRSLPEGNVTLKIIRNQKLTSLQVNLKSAPKSQILAEEHSVQQLGLSVKELTQDIFLNYDIDFTTQGVWVSRVEEAGTASIGGLVIDDLILEVNNRKVKNLKGFKNIIEDIYKEKHDYIQFFVLNNSKTRFVYIKKPNQIEIN
jgi:serine protease Do